RSYLVPPLGHSGWVRAVRRIVEAEQIDLLIPSTDADVAAVSRARARLGARAFLPRADTVALCGDQYRLAERLPACGGAAPATHAVTDPRGLDRTWERLGRPSRAWCRVRAGAGSRGAIAVRSAAQARSWITYWRDMRGVPITAFTLSEFLPGRDFGGQTLWRDGALVLVKTYERLSYLGSGSQPSDGSAAGSVTHAGSGPPRAHTPAPTQPAPGQEP